MTGIPISIAKQWGWTFFIILLSHQYLSACSSETSHVITLPPNPDTSNGFVGYAIPTFGKAIGISNYSNKHFLVPVYTDTGKYIGDREGGFFLSSSDGLQWKIEGIKDTELYPLGALTTTTYTMLIGRGRGQKGGLLISEDLKVWNKVISVSSPSLLSGVSETHNNTMIAFGGIDQLYRSEDIKKWERVDISGVGVLRAAAAGNELTVIVGDSSILMSHDTKNWEVNKHDDVGLPSGLMHIEYGNEVFIALGVQNSYRIYVFHTKEERWAEVNLSYAVENIKYYSDSFYLMSSDGILYKSNQGQEWNEVNNFKYIMEKGVNCTTHDCFLLGNTVIAVYL